MQIVYKLCFDCVILVNILIIKANCLATLFKDLNFKYIYLTFQKTFKLCQISDYKFICIFDSHLKADCHNYDRICK